jgi:hypothetical protein
VARAGELCAEQLVKPVDEVLATWELELVDGEPPPDAVLLEGWLYFPQRKGELPRFLARQSYDHQWTLRTDAIDPLDFRVRQRQFGTYPEEARGLDTSDSRCEVRVHVTHDGLPREPEVSDCDEVFHAAAAATLRSYRFRPPKIGGSPASSAFTAEVAFTMEVDDGQVVPKVEVTLPPDVIGQTKVLDEVPATDEILPPPTWDPLLVLDHGSYAEVRVFSIVWPQVPPSDEERACSLLLQVNSRQQNVIWPEACPDDLAPTVVAAAEQWRLIPGEVERGERYARFRADVVFPPGDAEPYLRVPSDDLVSVDRDTKDRVRTYAKAAATRRVAPKLPADFAAVVEQAECEVQLTVSPKGRAEDIEVQGCDEVLHPHAVKALAKWRWDPAEVEGSAIPTPATVRMRFPVP